MATEQELSNFLIDIESRSYRRARMHVRDDDAALDIVQESMMKLVENYGAKPIAEIGLLFQRILSNCIMDWFRAQKNYNKHFVNFSEFEASNHDFDGVTFDLLETLAVSSGNVNDSALSQFEQKQFIEAIEQELEKLPARQREAFLLRYWEELDLEETASVMGCSAGSVKTHCFRAIDRLNKALKDKDI